MCQSFRAWNHANVQTQRSPHCGHSHSGRFSRPVSASCRVDQPVRLTFSALAHANPPFRIAHELKLFEKYGLETEFVYISGSRPIQVRLGGSVDDSQVGGAAPALSLVEAPAEAGTR
jgi:ABC-type nitrate/sulfonate/bicarbonate transport system substrate-binding protein